MQFLPGHLLSEVVVPVRVSGMNEIHLFKKYSDYIGPKN